MAAFVRSLIAAFLLVLVSVPALAAFPSTPTRYYACQTGTISSPDPHAACNNCLRVRNGLSPSAAPWLAGAAWSGAGIPTDCAFAPAYNTFNSLGSSVVNVCPANSTLSGSSCTCNSGYEEAGGACISQQEVLCAGLSGHTTYASAPGSVMPGATSCSAVGCQITYGSTVIRVKNPQGQTVTEGDATITSTPCTYTAETGSVEDSCPGGSEGQVNGVTVCVPHDNTNVIESVSEDSSESTDVDENGDPKSNANTSTTKTTVCNGNSCSTTTTTTYSGSAGAGTKTDTKTESKADFCRDNPKSAQCGEGGKFLGSCTTNFTCTGDAVQCATAKAVNDHYCRFKDLMEMDTSTKALVDSVIAGTWVENPKDDPRIEPLGTFDQTNPLGDACPGDISLAISSVTVVIPLARFCPQLQMMGNLLVAFTLLGATVFVVRGST